MLCKMKGCSILLLHCCCFFAIALLLFHTFHPPSFPGKTTAIQPRGIAKEGKISPSNYGLDNRDTMKLDDYNAMDPVPVPSTTTSIRPGPIQHGSPQIPYVLPKPPSSPDPPPSPPPIFA